MAKKAAPKAKAKPAKAAPAKAAKQAKPVKPAKAQKPAPAAKVEKVEKTEKVEKAPKVVEKAVKAEKPSKAEKVKAEKVKAPEGASEDYKKWIELKNRHGHEKAAAYSMSGVYETGKAIDHKVLGWGWIMKSENDRLEVLFEQGLKYLISNYKPR